MVPREKSTLGKQSLKSLPDPDQMEKSTIQRKTLDPVWEEKFELLLVEQPRVLVMEVWDDDMAQQIEGRNAIKGLRGLRFKIIDFLMPGQDDFLGKYILSTCIENSIFLNSSLGDYYFPCHVLANLFRNFLENNSKNSNLKDMIIINRWPLCTYQRLSLPGLYVVMRTGFDNKFFPGMASLNKYFPPIILFFQITGG